MKKILFTVLLALLALAVVPPLASAQVQLQGPEFERQMPLAACVSGLPKDTILFTTSATMSKTKSGTWTYGNVVGIECYAKKPFRVKVHTNGNTSAAIFEGCDESDSSYLYSDTSASTAWSVAMNTYDEHEDFGPYIYPQVRYIGATNNSSTFFEEDVTDYIKDVVENNRYSACFIFNGKYTGGIKYIEYALHNVSAGLRPYLVVKVAE